MSFKKILKSKKGQAVLEYVILSALLATLILAGGFVDFKKNNTSFIPKAKDRLTAYFNDANRRIAVGFQNPHL